MRKSYQDWKRIFHAPDGTGAADANQGGAKVEIVDDPFAKMDFNDFDPETRKLVEAAKTKLTSLQESVTQAEAKIKLGELQAQKLQSERDKLKAGTATPELTGREAHLATFQKILGARGVPETQRVPQSELMLELMEEFGKTLKQDIGRDLGPLASSVISREAEFAYSQAEQTDKLGMLQVPEVAKQVQEQITAMVQSGQPVSSQVVKNLASMVYTQHLEANGGTPNLQQSQSSVLPNFGGRVSGNHAYKPQQPQGKQASVLDADTDRALQVVMGEWFKSGVKPKAYRGGK
jgi:hypothetical protein